MAKWLGWLVTGVVLAGVGIVLILVGLNTDDKIGSVIGAVSGVVGIALSVYALIASRREKRTPGPTAGNRP